MKLVFNTRAELTLRKVLEVSTVLPDELQWLDTDEIIESEGCCFFAHFVPGGTTSARNHFEDETGFECFVNHFHFQADSPSNAFAVAFVIYTKVQRLWGQFKNRGRRIRHIVGIEEQEVSYRFHVIRDKQSWLASNLDQYLDSTIVLE